MDVDIPSTPIDEPVFSIDDEVLLEIVKVVRQQAGLSATGAADTKRLLNCLFSVSLEKLHNLLQVRDPASWILEAYKQVEMWTFVYRSDMDPYAEYEAPRELAPAGRYGWRYVIDHLLPAVSKQKLHLARPDTQDVSQAFTALVLVQLASEWSNYIHHFPDIFGEVSISLDGPMDVLNPVLSNQAHAALAQRAKYLQQVSWRTWKKYPNLDPGLSDRKIRNVLGNGLKDSMGFSLDDLDAVIEVLVKEVLSSGLIIVHSHEYLVSWVSDVSSISKKVTSRALDFMLLSHNHLASSPREILDKNEPIRMINFAGVKLPQLTNLEAIYAQGAARKSSIQRAKHHVILSIFMLAEWQDIFLHQCSNGQRSDLKTNVRLNRALEWIEQYQRRQVFETGVAKILEDHGFKCLVGLKKWPGKDGRLSSLPCGEIDILAYHSASGVLVIAECKANAPATDARGYSQQYKDHFGQKKYHSKYLRKVTWLSSSDTDLQVLCRFHRDIRINSRPLIVPLFVTKYPSVARFYTDEYRVLTVEELDMEIDALVRVN